MAVETSRGVSPQVDGVNHLLPWTVMTGGAGTGTVSWYIMFGAINFGPGRYDMTVAAGLPWRSKRKIAGGQLYGMRVPGMECVKSPAMAVGAVAKAGLADG